MDVVTARHGPTSYLFVRERSLINKSPTKFIRYFVIEVEFTQKKFLNYTTNYQNKKVIESK